MTTTIRRQNAPAPTIWSGVTRNPTSSGLGVGLGAATTQTPELAEWPGGQGLGMFVMPVP